MPENQNEDLKAKMRASLERKQQGAEGVEDSGHHGKEKGPAERGRQGGGGLFRRKAGGGG